MKDMDTSILNTLSLIAPDLMEEMELRTLILERVAALEPIGRRALAARLHLAEREVRAAAEALKRAGCLTQSASGMESIPQDSPYYTRSRRLVKFLNYFKDCGDESEIPPTSILREFIGGCTFYDE